MSSRAWIPLLFLVLAAMSVATAAEPWTVELTDGKTYQGTLVRLQPGRYLLQTSDALLELSEDDIAPSTFAGRSRQDAIPERKVHEIRQYYELHPDQTMTRWSTRREVNTSKKAITSWEFGLAPWEQTVIDQRAFYDWLGNPLTPRFDPPQEKWSYPPQGRVQVTIPLPVPVAPGEEAWITTRETSLWISHKDEGYVYTFNGDFAEDNLVWLKVRLPRGAQIKSITPPPSARFSDAGLDYVMWRRFYKEGEQTPLKIVYTLE